MKQNDALDMSLPPGSANGGLDMPLPPGSANGERTRAAHHDVMPDPALPGNQPSLLLDRLAQVAASALALPVSIVSIVDDDRLVFTGQYGLSEPWASSRQIPLGSSICQQVMRSGAPLVTADIREEPGMPDASALGLAVVAYAGMPIWLDGDDRTAGVFCAVDFRRRDWTPRDLGILRNLAAAAGEEISSRRRAFLAEKLDEELRGAIAVLERDYSESMRVVRDIEHDIRTPLGTIALAVDTLRLHSDSRASANVVELLQVLARSVERAAELAQTLGSSASGRHRAVLVDLADVAADVCADVRKLRPDLDIELRGPDTCIVHGDRSALRRCLQNLIGNAERFAATRIALELSLRDGIVRVAVHDDGPGLPKPDDYRNAWQRSTGFHHDIGKSGSGLGLSIVRSIVMRHDGDVIAAPSRLGGAMFGFDLPLPANGSGGDT